MRFSGVLLCAIAGATAWACPADAGIISFEFGDPAGQREVTYAQPSAGNGGVASLSYNAGIDILFGADLTQVGGSALSFPGTRLALSATVGSATTAGTNTFVAPITGTFVFTWGAQPILTGTFANGTLVVARNAGSVVATIDPVGDNPATLSMVAGGALLTALNGVGVSQLAPQFDAVWTLTALTQAALTSWFETPYIASFQSNASFSATAMPTPGSLALLGVAGLVGVRRRR
ncbi:MAG: hypothetical protein IBJ11_04910 [Phycisphaerales bacterium]|nr:hypothetical protein [Phycisphaerales bacterium]